MTGRPEGPEVDSQGLEPLETSLALNRRSKRRKRISHAPEGAEVDSQGLLPLENSELQTELPPREGRRLIAGEPRGAHGYQRLVLRACERDPTAEPWLPFLSTIPTKLNFVADR